MSDPNRLHRPVTVGSHSFDGGRSGALVGRSRVVVELKDLVTRVAAASTPVVIAGERGTGKEEVARIIHAESRRRDGPFVKVICGSFSPASIADELFASLSGAERGALVEADGGTLFLDEVADMPALMQTRMLRVLQGGELRIVGSRVTRHVDVRWVAATSTDLQAEVARGAFREDLFFRLNVLAIQIPPLRERPEDIPLLVEHFLSEIASHARAPAAPTFTPDAMKRLEERPWPGNLRELAKLVERLARANPGRPIDADAVQADVTPSAHSDAVQALVAARLTLEAIEALYIAGVLEYTRGNKARAAEILGIDPSTLYRREKHRPS